MTKDENAMIMLPRLMEQLELLNSETMQEYENKLNETLKKALNMLQQTIDDGSLALDPESLVESIKVLTNAKHIIADDKRKALETTFRGIAMQKAINDESNKNDNNKDSNQSLLDKYFASQIPQGMTLEDTRVNSVFNVDDNSDTESSSDT